MYLEFWECCAEERVELVDRRPVSCLSGILLDQESRFDSSREILLSDVANPRISNKR